MPHLHAPDEADAPATLAERAPGLLKPALEKALSGSGALSNSDDTSFGAAVGETAARSLGSELGGDERAGIMHRATAVAGLQTAAGDTALGIRGALRAITALHMSAQGTESAGPAPSYGLEHLRAVMAHDIAEYFTNTFSSAQVAEVADVIDQGRVQNDLDRAVEAASSGERLLSLELEGTVAEVVRLRGLMSQSADQDERGALGQAIGETSRRALLLNQALIPIQDAKGQSGDTPLDVQVMAAASQIAGMREASTTEKATRGRLTAGGQPELDLLTPQDVTIQDPAFPEHAPEHRTGGRAPTGLADMLSGDWRPSDPTPGTAITPDEALPETTDAAADRLMSDMESRVSNQHAEVKRLRGQVVPSTPRYDLAEFADVFRRWFGFFSLGQEAQDPIFALLIDLLGATYNLMGSAALELSDPLYGKISAAQGGFARSWLMDFVAEQLEGNMGSASDQFAGQLKAVAPGRRQDELSGSVTAPHLPHGELYPDPYQRHDPSPGGEERSRKSVQERNQSDTSSRFTDVAKREQKAKKQAEQSAKLGIKPAPGSDPVTAGKVAAVEKGLVPPSGPHVPLLGMRNVEAREGWSYLMQVWDPNPANPQLVAREQQVMRPEVAQYLLARRQQVGALEAAHVPMVGGKRAGDFSMRMSGVEAGTATSTATYVRGEDMPQPSAAAQKLRSTLQGAREDAGVRPTKPQGRGSRGPDTEQRLVRELIVDLERYLEGYFRTHEEVEYRLAAVFVIANVQFRLGEEIMKLVEPSNLAKILLEAGKLSAITSGLNSLGRVGKVAAKGYQAHLAFQGVSDIAAIISIVSFLRNAGTQATSLEKARIWALMSRHIVGDLSELVETVVGKVSQSAVQKGLERLASSRPATPSELAAMCRPMMSDPAARKALLDAVEAEIRDLEKSGVKPDIPDADHRALTAFRDELRNGKTDNPAAKEGLPGKDDPSKLRAYEEARSRTADEWEGLINAVPPDLAGRVPLVENPNLQGRTVHVVYGNGKLRIEIGPGAKPEHVRAHAETARQLLRYEGVTGHIRRLIDRVLTLLRLGPPGYGTLGFEAKLERDKLTAMIAELERMQGQIDARGEQLHKGDPAAQADAIAKDIESLREQLKLHEGNIGSYEAARGFVAATDTRAAAPRKPGVYEATHPDKTPEGWQFKERVWANGTKFRTVLTTFTSPSGATGMAKRRINLATGAIDLQEINVPKEAGWIQIKPELVQGQGMRTAAYLTMRQMHVLEVQAGSLRTITVRDLYNVKALLELRDIRAKDSTLTLAQAVMQTNSITSQEAAIIQSGHTMGAATIKENTGKKGPLDDVLKYWETKQGTQNERDPEIMKRHDALLQTHGLTREQAETQEFFFGFDIEIPLTPLANAGGATGAP